MNNNKLYGESLVRCQYLNSIKPNVISGRLDIECLLKLSGFRVDPAFFIPDPKTGVPVRLNNLTSFINYLIEAINLLISHSISCVDLT